MWRLCLIILLFVVGNEPRTIDEIISAALDIDDGGKTREDTVYVLQGSPVEYVKVGLDMILPLETWLSMNDDQNVTTQRHKRNAVKDRTKLWGRIIPYKVDDGFNKDERLEIEGAIKHWKLYSCLTFREASPSDFSSIHFIPTADSHYLMCSSFVGMIGGEQLIVLTEGCREKRVIIHEIGHAIGLYNEHQRTDRDDYVTINWDNLSEDTPYMNVTRQFVKLKPSMENNYSIPYDYTSIMHFGKWFMSKERGSVTLVTKDPSYQDTIGEATGLSFNDIQLVNAMYRCDAGCVPKECPDGGFLGKWCSCWCRSSGDSPVARCDMEEPEGHCGVPAIDTEVYTVYTRTTWTPVDLDLVQSFPNGTRFNVALENCNCGYEFETIVCVQGNWTGQPPACQPVDICCLIPKSNDPDDTNYLYKLGNESLFKGERIGHNETITVLCEFLNLENYDYENGLMETNITCSNGTWIGEHPQNCPSGSCKLPPYGRNTGDIVKFILKGKLFLSRHDDIQHNDTVTQLCPTGDFPPERTVTCTLGAWNTDDGEFPLCKKASITATTPAVTTAKTTKSSIASSSPEDTVYIVVGVSLGGIVLISIGVILTFLYRKRYRRRRGHVVSEFRYREHASGPPSIFRPIREFQQSVPQPPGNDINRNPGSAHVNV